MAKFRFVLLGMVLGCLVAGFSKQAGAEIKLMATPASSAILLQSPVAAAGQGAESETISFRLNMEKKALVELEIVNEQGKRVATLRRLLPPGPGVIVWHCQAVPRGTFQARVKIDGVEKKSKIKVVK